MSAEIARRNVWAEAPFKDSAGRIVCVDRTVRGRKVLESVYVCRVKPYDYESPDYKLSHDSDSLYMQCNQPYRVMCKQIFEPTPVALLDVEQAKALERGNREEYQRIEDIRQSMKPAFQAEAAAQEKLEASDAS